MDTVILSLGMLMLVVGTTSAAYLTLTTEARLKRWLRKVNGMTEKQPNTNAPSPDDMELGEITIPGYFGRPDPNEQQKAREQSTSETTQQAAAPDLPSLGLTQPFAVQTPEQGPVRTTPAQLQQLAFNRGASVGGVVGMALAGLLVYALLQGRQAARAGTDPVE
jgi:hypothetical protein